MNGAVQRAGYIAIVGRPNVGKSTLLNRLVGQKLSITSRKAQTTRHRVTGILTRGATQYVFVDTPGYQTERAGALNRLMNHVVTRSLREVDVALFVVEAGRFDARDARVAKELPRGVPTLLVINKTDRMADPRMLLPFIDRVRGECPFAAIVPVSAQTGAQLGELLDEIRPHLPQSDALYEGGEWSDRDERFFAAEFLREKLYRLLGEELPYSMTVVVDRFERRGGLRRIAASILVDKVAHRAIVIGAGGARLKTIASQARADLEQLFGGKVFLEVWVKVRRGWADDERALKQLGYG
ncbi:MAG TPA: GTPase Era [Burkholderiales bacterium]|nr:GTPase Era [Burkholderiales bacterium]